MRFASLGSGSEGNALVVEVDATRIMLDCGFGVRDTGYRLAHKKLSPEQITAIVITHEHADHLGGAASFARKYGIPVWMTHGTFQVFRQQHEILPVVHIFDSHSRFSIDNIELQPFPVPHDAREPAQFVFTDGKRRLGVLTDVGTVTQHIITMLSGCDALVLECNHDTQLLAQSSYPYGLKKRIAGQFGHLDNQTAATLLSQVGPASLQHLVAAHLSRQNNRPDLALGCLAGVLGDTPDWLGYADQEQGCDWRTLL